MKEFSDLPGVFTTVLDDGTVTAMNTRGEEWNVRCPLCLGGEQQATCGHCAGRGHVDHVPYPERPWDEVAPGLFVGGHVSQQVNPVVVANEFDVVVSLHQEPEGVEVYGPPPGVVHLTYTIRDAALNPSDHANLDGLASHVEDSVRHGDKVLVRCMAGINRSSLVAALAMVKMGYQPDEAVEVIREIRSPYCLFNESFVSYVRSKG